MKTFVYKTLFIFLKTSYAVTLSKINLFIVVKLERTLHLSFIFLSTSELRPELKIYIIYMIL